MAVTAGRRCSGGARTRLTARGREHIANERRAINLELVAMLLFHGTLLIRTSPAANLVQNKW
jgi:hypothetical protein